MQLDTLRAAGCEEIFVEKATGAQRDRPEMQAAFRHLREGDTLVVWKLDRLARSMKQLIETIEGLEDQGVGFRALTEAIDTTTSGGRLLFHVFGASAEFECSIIRERTRAGLDAARARGRKGGRPAKLTEKDIKAARAMLLDKSITVEEVARHLRVSPATLYRYLPASRSQAEE